MPIVSCFVGSCLGKTSLVRQISSDYLRQRVRIDYAVIPYLYTRATKLLIFS